VLGRDALAFFAGRCGEGALGEEVSPAQKASRALMNRQGRFVGEQPLLHPRLANKRHPERRRMNILHVIDSGGLYGAEMVLLNLMTAQKEMGLSPSMLSIGNLGVGEKYLESEAKRRGLNVITLRFRNGLNIWGALEIFNISRRLNIQIIHSHGYKGDILIGLLPRRIRNIPIIATMHGWTSTRIFSKLNFYELIDAVAMKNLDSVVAVSASIVEKKMIKLLNIRPVIINNGINENEYEKGVFKDAFPSVADKFRDRFKVLAIGRLSKEKGYDILIRAIAGLASENIDIGLLIIGEGEERSRLEKLVSILNLHDTVYLAGYEQDARRFMADFDVFVVPSLTEGLPITILEAMQAEIQIVATRVGEIPILINDGELGDLAEPNNVEDLSNKIKRAYVNKRMAGEKTKKTKKKALSNYGVANMAAQYLDLYKKVIIAYAMRR